MIQNEIKEILTQNLKDCSVDVLDPRQDGVHLEAHIVSSDFEGLSLLARHRKVMGLLKELFEKRLHALSIKTFTPQEKGI